MIKKYIVFCLFVCYSTILHAQGIVDFFYSIPANYIDGLTYLERKTLIEIGELHKDDMAYYLEVDKANGYIRLDQSYTEGQSGYQIYELTYWNMTGKKLIALSSISGSNGGAHQQNFKFYEYENGALQEARYGYLKGYTSNFDIFMNNLISDFTIPNLKQEQKDELVSEEFLIQLPRYGKDIIVHVDSSTNPEYFKQHYAKFFRITNKRYLWSDATQRFE